MADDNIDPELETPEGKFELAIYDAQFELIKKECGAKAAEMANYGWGVAADDEEVSIATKVYGFGVLVTNGNYATKAMSHEWRD